MASDNAGGQEATGLMALSNSPKLSTPGACSIDAGALIEKLQPQPLPPPPPQPQPQPQHMQHMQHTQQPANIFSRKSSQGIPTGPRACAFCRRTFQSQHALDIHLSRNMECRTEYRKSVAAAHEAGSAPPSVSRDPVVPGQRPERNSTITLTAMDECCRVLAALSKTMEPKVHLQHVRNDVLSVLQKVEARGFKNLFEVKDAVLQVWQAALTRSGATSQEYADVKMLCRSFDEMYERTFDDVRGLGGIADLSCLQHGGHWLGQQVRVYWPKEHVRMEGVIDDHDQIDNSTHIYHIVYQDGNEQWTVLPHKHVELVGWVSHTEERTSGDAAAYKHSGLEAQKKCTLVAAKERIKAAAKVGDTKRQKIAKAPGVLPSAQGTHGTLQEKLQARMIKQKRVRNRPPAFAENQAVEVTHESSLHQLSQYAKGIITRVHIDSTYDILLPETGARENGVPEARIRARQTTKVRFDFLPLVQELRRKVHYDFYDDPVDEDLVSGYYHSDPAANQWSITSWGRSSMCFSWMEAKAQSQQYASIAAVERDFNNIIENATTFNFASDIVNKEAVRLFHACKNVFSKWQRKPHIYCCSICSDEAIPDDNNMQLLICDGCCEAIHVRCFAESKHGRLLFEQEDLHPFRQDQAHFCSVCCFNDYQRIASHFQLQHARPPLRQLQVEPMHSSVPGNNRIMAQQQPLVFRPSAAQILSDHSRPSSDHARSLLNAQPSVSQTSLQAQAGGEHLGVQAPPRQIQTASPNKVSVDVPTKKNAEVPAADQTNQSALSTPKNWDRPIQGAQTHGVKESLSLVQAMRASKKEEKEQVERLQSLQQMLQQNLLSNHTNPSITDPDWKVISMLEEALKACGNLMHTTSSGAVHTQKFLTASGGSVGAAQATAVLQGKLQQLQGLSRMFDELLNAKNSERRAFYQVQQTQLGLQNVLQTAGDPPEELLDAAESACEAYEKACGATNGPRQRYLAFMATVPGSG